MAKRMTIEGVRAAKDRAVAMFENFGREDEANEFDSMTPEEYAERRDIEIVYSNPSTLREERPMTTRRRNPAERADALGEENKELRSQLDRIYGIVAVADSIDSEQGLRSSLGRIAGVVGVDSDDDEGDEYEGDDEGDEGDEDEGDEDDEE